MPREVLFLTLTALYCLLMACSRESQVTETQPASESPQVADQLAGSWRLVSWTRRSSSGETVYPHGPDAFGRIIYQPAG